MSKDQEELWQEELSFLRGYLAQQAEIAARERIKELTLMKLAQYPTEVEAECPEPHPDDLLTYVAKGIVRRSRALWWRWHWKAAIPLMFMIVVAGLGYGVTHASFGQPQGTAQSAAQRPGSPQVAAEQNAQAAKGPQTGSVPKSSETKSAPVGPPGDAGAFSSTRADIPVQSGQANAAGPAEGQAVSSKTLMAGSGENSGADKNADKTGPDVRAGATGTPSNSAVEPSPAEPRDAKLIPPEDKTTPKGESMPVIAWPYIVGGLLVGLVGFVRLVHFRRTRQKRDTGNKGP